MLSIAIYDPHRLKEDDFVTGFVARTELVEFLLNQLRSAKEHGEIRHRLFIGQRGMGKTSLLRRLAIAISREADLAKRYMPLTFREEQYNVRSMEFFWRNCAESIAEQMEESGRADLAAKIDELVRTGNWRDPRTACDNWLSLVRDTRKRPVLLVDNI